VRVRGVVIVGLLGAAAPLAPGETASAADPELRRLRPGVFLYASPRLREPNFSETVVLLIEYGPKGAMGLVIDRPTGAFASDVLKEAKGLAQVPIYWGGPVQPDAVFGLVRTRKPSKGAVAVFPDVFLTGKRKDLEAAVKGSPSTDSVRIYLGYAGWGAGQLEGEVRHSGWIVNTGDAASVFSPEPEKLWKKAYQLLERLEAARNRPASRLVARFGFREPGP
jgi:putative transcriptional regulator